MVVIVVPYAMRTREQFCGRGTAQEVRKNKVKSKGCIHRNGADVCLNFPPFWFPQYTIFPMNLGYFGDRLPLLSGGDLGAFPQFCEPKGYTGLMPRSLSARCWVGLIFSTMITSGDLSTEIFGTTTRRQSPASSSITSAKLMTFSPS